MFMKKLAMNNPAANVRKNGRTLFITPRYSMQFHLMKAYVNVYAAFSNLVSKIKANPLFYSILFRVGRKAFCCHSAKEFPLPSVS